MLNNCTFMGRLTSTPELKKTNDGVSVTSFTIAVERNYAPKGKERDVDFIPVVAWRAQADFATKYFQKGSLICLEGSMQSRNYTDKNGIKRTQLELNVGSIHFTGEKHEQKQFEQNYQVSAQGYDTQQQSYQTPAQNYVPQQNNQVQTQNFASQQNYQIPAQGYSAQQQNYQVPVQNSVPQQSNQVSTQSSTSQQTNHTSLDEFEDMPILDLPFDMV